MKRVSLTAAEVDAMIVAALSRDMGPDEREAVGRRPWTSRWWAAPVALLGLAVFLAVVYAAAPNGPHRHVEAGK